MEFETWNRDTLIKEVKTAMAKTNFQSSDNFLDLLIKLKYYSDDELRQKTDYELQNIYIQLKEPDEAFCREYEESQEKKQFFNQPNCNADFGYWSKQAYWSIDEAILLMLGKDPGKVFWDDVKTYIATSPFVKRFNELRELARRYVNYKELYDPVFPGIFLAWAERMNISIPTELKEAVNILGIQVGDWKSCYEQASEQYNRLNKRYSEALDLIKTKNEIIEVLNLRTSNIEENQQQLDTDSLKETERQSLYKLIAAMAYDGFGYNPTEKKSTIPKEISDAVTRYLGENIDTDTARKWLKKASDQYPNQIFGKTE